MVIAVDKPITYPSDFFSVVGKKPTIGFAYKSSSTEEHLLAILQKDHREGNTINVNVLTQFVHLRFLKILEKNGDKEWKSFQTVLAEPNEEVNGAVVYQATYNEDNDLEVKPPTILSIYDADYFVAVALCTVRVHSGTSATNEEYKRK